MVPAVIELPLTIAEEARVNSVYSKSLARSVLRLRKEGAKALSKGRCAHIGYIHQLI